MYSRTGTVPWHDNYMWDVLNKSPNRAVWLNGISEVLVLLNNARPEVVPPTGRRDDRVVRSYPSSVACRLKVPTPLCCREVLE